ncbi:M23 family metallopeptidase [Microbacterium sp. NPDC087868]|uniref:M23 family metallopeptidase n=1 Tax=Microbacterium sp. NPDC087868 TaxID=3364195 RepID=UPI00384AAA27
MTRRSAVTFLSILAGAAALGAVGLDADPALAAPEWGHPFTFYSNRSRGFTGRYNAGGHAGIDYTPGPGTPIHAVADGVVTLSGISGSQGAFGESIWIQHSDGFVSISAHMQEGTRIPYGTVVSRGDYIGRVGNTGKSYGAHLHLEIRHNGIEVDPDPLVDRNRTAPLAGTTPPPPPPPKETEVPDTLVIRNNETGHIYTIGTEYIRHESTTNGLGPAVNLHNFTPTNLWRRDPSDGIVKLEGWMFASYIASRGIPQDKPLAVVPGKLWSRSNDIWTKVSTL